MNDKTELLFSTGCVKNYPSRYVFNIFSNLGFNYIEYNPHNIIHGNECIDEVLESSINNKINVRMLSGGWCDFFSTEKHIHETLRSIEQQVVVSDALGCKKIRLFLGRLQALYESQEVIDNVINNIIYVADQYPETTFFFENHDGLSLNPDFLKGVFGGVNRKNVQMNFDFVNFEIHDIDAMSAFNNLKPFIGHLHIKGKKKQEYCEYGRGDSRIDIMLNRVKEEKLPFGMTLEYEGNQESVISLIQSKEALDKKGYC